MNSPNDTFTTKRTINHRTKQIETRIQRQIVIEDGKVVSDTGPLVTTKTLEDNKQEIDEIEENYAFSNSSKFDSNWSGNSKELPNQDKTKSKSSPKAFMFGYTNEQTADVDEPDKNAIIKSGKFQDKNNDQKWNKTKKYFYFGQNINDIDIKEKENLQVDTSDQSTKTFQRKMPNSNHVENDIYNTEEKNCQIAYEYSNFSRYGDSRI